MTNISYRQRLYKIVILILIFVCLTGNKIWATGAQSGIDSLSVAPADEKSVHPLLLYKKDRPTIEKILRFPIHVIEFPFWLAGHGLENTLHFVESNNLVEKAEYLQQFLDEHHILVDDGSQGAGSGLGLEVGFSRDIKPINLTVSSAVTYRIYQRHLIELCLPEVFNKYTELSTWIQYRVRTQDNFFGVGNESKEKNRTQYYQSNMNAGIAFSYNPHHFKISGLFDLTNYSKIKDSMGDDFPSTKDIFPNLTGMNGLKLYGIGMKITYPSKLYKGLTVPESGIELSARSYWDADGGNYGFNQYTLMLYQTIPIFGGDRVVALRLIGSTTDPIKDRYIPFFVLNHLGGSTDLRGYENYRFMERDIFLLNFEYRYPVWDLGLPDRLAMDFVWFYDAGMVSHAIEKELSVNSLLSSYGIGLRVRKNTGTVIRLNLSRSSEMIRVDLKFGKDF